MSSKVQEQLRSCAKLLTFLQGHKDAGPFLEPVKWKEWGLLDYPKVVKNPMDLGTVKDKLESNSYVHPKEFKHDVNLVWHNCMTYNADGSEYWMMAAGLKRIFEEKYAKMVKDDDDAPTASGGEVVKPPTLLDKKVLSQNIYNIGAEDLGRVVHILDRRCESCIKKIDPEDLEIDLDAIDSATFWVVDQFVKECLPGTKKGGAAKSKAGSGAAAVGAKASDGARANKKARV